MLSILSSEQQTISRWFGKGGAGKSFLDSTRSYEPAHRFAYSTLHSRMLPGAGQECLSLSKTSPYRYVDNSTTFIFRSHRSEPVTSPTHIVI